MPFLTVRFDAIPDDAERGRVGAAAGAGVVRWRDNPAFNRTYALLDVDERASLRVRAEFQTRVQVYLGAIIALAVVPAQPEALPSLLDALGGAGRPAGVRSAERHGGAVLVEWDPARTLPSVVLSLIEIELRRFGGGRTAALLAPLAPEVAALIARDGLRTSQIAPDRMLEVLLERVGLET